MRTGHDFDGQGGVQRRSPSLVRRIFQTGILAYWLPCLTVDFYVLWSWGHGPAGVAFTFWALFREAVVFLFLWFLLAAAQAIVFGGGAVEPGPRTRRLAA